MRVKRNSNLYSKFTPEQKVMGDKAEDLGFVWDRTKYPTPAWEFEHSLPFRPSNYEPRFSVPKDIWNRELRLWSADCAERVLPIWEDWAEINALRYLNVPRAAVIAVRESAYGGKIESESAPIAIVIAVRDIARSYIRNLSVSYSFDAAYYACEPDGKPDGRTAYCAAFALGYLSDRIAERLWQKAALANRIDAVAPWRLQ